MTTLGNNKRSAGFTLLEIIVVITLIGVLAAAGVGVFNEVRKQARDERRAADLLQLQIAIEAYKDTYGEYPDRCASSGGGWSGNVAAGTYRCVNPTDGFILGLVPEFITELPKDPLYDNQPANYGYLYNVDATNSSYKLLAYQVVESDYVDWSHPLARCPVQCDGDPGASSQCTTGTANFINSFHDTYGVYSAGSRMCQ